MSTPTWGLDPKSRRISVYFVGETTIYEGMPVCYDNSTSNWLGVDGSSIDFTTTASTITEGLTTADGNLNEGKFIRVERPNADNCGMFAGVVAGADHAGETGPRALDIYIANGAVVPVRTDLNCLVDQTILAITTGEEELGVPLETDSRAVAIARETSDLGTAGLVLAELCPERFVYQDSGGTALSVDDADTTTASLVNSINLKFLGSANYQKGLYAVGEIAGAGACLYGMWKFRTYLNAATTRTCHTLCTNLHIKDAGTLSDVGEQAHSALYVTVETDVTATAPTLSGGNLAAIMIGYYVDETTAAPLKAYPFSINTDLTKGQFDGLFTTKNTADIAFTTGAAATNTSSIPIEIAGTTHYLMVSAAAVT